MNYMTEKTANLKAAPNQTNMILYLNKILIDSTLTLNIIYATQGANNGLIHMHAHSIPIAPFHPHK